VRVLTKTSGIRPSPRLSAPPVADEDRSSGRPIHGQDVQDLPAAIPLRVAQRNVSKLRVFARLDELLDALVPEPVRYTVLHLPHPADNATGANAWAHGGTLQHFPDAPRTAGWPAAHMIWHELRIRNIPNDDLVSLAPQLSGLNIQTGSTDHNGRLVSGNILDAKVMEDGRRIAIKLTRYINGQHLPDSITVPSGTDPLGRPWHTAVHVREGSDLLAALEAA
jgi:hypothetical protein